jgi:glycosyltransferase involved in cell wall biosynthesis
MATFNERMASEYLSMGHRVTIYTFSLQYPSFLFPGTSQYSKDKAPKDLDIRVRVNSVNPFNWEIVGRELRDLAPDLIVVRFWIPLMGPALGRILRIARKNGRTRIVCIADNIIPHEKRPGDLWFTRYFLRAPDAFVTMSGKVTEDLRAFGTAKPMKQLKHPLYDHFGEPLPKAEARQHIGLPAEGRLILFFGFIRHYKGLDLLLEAMADPRIRDAGIRLLVAGEFYQDPRPYHEQINRLALGDTVILHSSFIPDNEVRYYCSAVDLIVQPYRNATQSGVTPLAYHFEKPMLVTRVGGLPEMVPEGSAGLVAEPDPASIASGILEFYRTGEDHFIKGLREEKKNYAWRSFCEEILALSHDH